MWKRKVNSIFALVVAAALFGNLAAGATVDILPLNKPADLDLSGEVLYAINFGNNGNPTFGTFVFHQDQDYPNVIVGKSAEGVVNTWGATYPNTGNADLDMLLGGIIWKNSSTSGRTTSITITNGLTIGRSYRLQLVFYTDHTRPMSITVGGSQIVEQFDPFVTQGSVGGKGGCVVKCAFTAGDTTLNIYVTPNPDVGDASAISGLILTKAAEPTAFADYGSGTTTELVSGKGTWQLNWGQGPWTWCDNAAQPLLGSNVSSFLALQTTAAAKVSADLVATLPIAGTLTLSAHDKSNGNMVIGTMVLTGTGVNIIDLNASRVLVDQGTGMGLAPFRPPGPEVALTLDQATGVFAYIKQAGDWRLQLAGLYAMPLMKGVKLQDNIMSALAGKVPLIGGLGDFALSGQYEPVESMKPKSFCEYGTAVAAQFGAAGGLWNQTWAGGPWPWHKCPATVNAKFLGQNVSGELETTTTGTPTVDEKMILRSGFSGRITLTDHDDTTPAKIDGQIIGDVKGTFVADANAAHATFDSKGNIVCAFGVTVHNAPDAFITVTKVTGSYADIHQAGDWAWYVNGIMTIAKVPTLSVQQNILAALQRPELLLGAQEEFVLTGWYYRE
jgi:hypothetical protein